MNVPPRKIFIMTDAGRDHDDELAFTILAGLQKQGLCEIVGAVANLHPVQERAQLVKGAFTSMGINIPVAQGDPGEPDYEPKAYEFDAPYMASPDDIENDGQALIKRVFEEARAKGEKITLLLISGMMDANQFILENEDLALAVLDQVTIMGDVKIDKNDQPMLDESGFLVAGNSYNNSVDRHLNDDPQADEAGPSAKNLYATLQKLSIPTTVLSRYAAYAAYITPDFYARLANTDHPLGVRIYNDYDFGIWPQHDGDAVPEKHPVSRRLHKDQQAAIENFWQDIQDGKVPSRMTREWFAATYCGGEEALTKLEADPNNAWAYVKRLNLYDPLAALAAIIPDVVFEPIQGLSASAAAFNVIGLTPEKHGIKDLSLTHELLGNLPHKGFTMTLTPEYPHALNQLDSDLAGAPDTDITALATRLVNGAKQYDMARSAKVLGHDYPGGIQRDFKNAVYHVADNVFGAPWADDPKQPLKGGEHWNKGKRASLTGTHYAFDQQGLPINPYAKTGIKGQGIIGGIGPNIAVDVGALTIKADEHGRKKLHAYGIMKGTTPAFCGGFAETSEQDSNGFVVGHDVWTDNQTKEFFEEMVSGSIILIEPYASRLETEFEATIASRVASRGGKALSDDKMEEVKEQVATGLKLQQVQDKDPEFFQRLYSVFDQSKECYAGPVSSSSRNTDTSWMETYLSWVMMDDETWDYICGENPPFNYHLSAGDDADDVLAHNIAPALLEGASGTHSAMFVYMAASYLLGQQAKGEEISPSIIQQMDGIVSFLENPNTLSIDTEPQP